MAQILGDMAAKKATDSKRKSDYAAATSSIVGSAAALAAAKRSRPSSLSGPDVGAAGVASAFAKQVEMGRDSKGASVVVRQLLLRCRNYGTVKYICRNCRNYGRKAPDPVVIHRQGGRKMPVRGGGGRTGVLTPGVTFSGEN